MPRFFFNVHDGTSAVDTEGTVLRDIYEAQVEAVNLSGELLRELGGSFWDGGIWKIEVLDHNRQILFTLSFVATEHGTSEKA